MIRLPFLEDSTPPPFYRPELSADERVQLDKWFIGHRSQKYYLRRFAEFDQAGKLHARWHWAACFATFGWLLYRKRYLDCFVYCVAGLAFVKLNMVIVLAAAEFLVIGLLPEMWQMTARLIIGGAVYGFWAVQVGRWSDAYYYRMARREIADALDKFPHNKEAQEAHLRQYGGVSLVGLGMAYGLFALMVGVIGLQFVPIVAKEKEQAITEDIYLATNRAKLQVANIYAEHGCPVGHTADLSQEVKGAKVQLRVVDEVLGTKADCAVVTTVVGVGYPVRYLREQSLVFYHEKDGERWRCQSSLNKNHKIRAC